MRFSLKIVGEAGQGVLSIGGMLTKALKRSSMYTFGYRENPSLIKGGITTYQIDISDKPIYSLQSKTDILCSICNAGVKERFFEARKDAVVIHPLAQLHLTDEQQEYSVNNNLCVQTLDVPAFLRENNLLPIMGNVYLMGYVWRMLGLECVTMETVLTEWFEKKPTIAEQNIFCFQKGFESAQALDRIKCITAFVGDESIAKHYLLDGTEAISLGSIAAGVRAYFAYPMSPASNILLHMSQYGKKVGVVTKQAEDEITAACMVIGANHMGTRSFTATSGGGFDLMTEAISMAAITETPFVCVLGQRPGPATGLPTWTTQGDLLMSIYSAHGESPKCVIALSDITSSYELMAEAFNIAERYQMVVIVLADKYGLEAYQQVASFPDITIERGNLITEQSLLDQLQATDRYDVASLSGVSKRWLPGAKAPTYDANTDEHTGDGSTTEDACEAVQSIDKRMRKLDALAQEISDPTLYGNSQGDILFVGWGSTKMVMMDILSLQDEFDQKISYLHYEYLWPLKVDTLKQHFSQFKKIVLVEGNKMGQLEILMKQAADFPIHFDDRLLKYDGRPFFLDDILDYIHDNTTKSI